MNCRMGPFLVRWEMPFRLHDLRLGNAEEPRLRLYVVGSLWLFFSSLGPDDQASRYVCTACAAAKS